MSDFFTATAEFMVKDAPEVYSDIATAKSDLYRNVETLRESGSPFITFGPYVLTMLDDEDVEDFYFAKKISSYAIFNEEQSAYAYSHIPSGVDLPYILDDPDYA